VSTLPDNSKKVVLNNYKNKNVTAVNGQQLLEDDVIRLADGNIITMGKTNIKVVM
jgi:pSer/pThr/pTyr-binding forkhead associated (FHA) protein